MSKLRKIDAETNVITWFEIPVLDSARAKAFYETILDIQMQTLHLDETNEELTFFPSDPSVVQATSGRVSGALTKSEHAKPSAEGTKVYLNAYPEIDLVLNRVEGAGGKIVVPKMQIRAGLIAVIEDTEGNRIGLHAEK
ncbi:VOC family protein [Chitinophaga filiformis]|uniref:VOC family protein n=1 Tax=Chitinophaga filiformis TaxID=104663 RepID=A0ABY4HT39_CHIFI|nr:VOC family protein [Chitinophaga filiformis]UPK66570.1 VOC family protein [Chitinophaga filiformis]